jgi:hypothetical protein
MAGDTYGPLHDLLVNRAGSGEDLCVLSFEEIAAVAGPLPAGAAHKKAWWFGRTSLQARAWESAGWRVDTVGFAARRVAFRREQ